MRRFGSGLNTVDMASKMYEPMIFVDVTHRRRNDNLNDEIAIEQTNCLFNKACFVMMFNELFRLFLLILRKADSSSLFTTSQAQSQWSP